MLNTKFQEHNGPLVLKKVFTILRCGGYLDYTTLDFHINFCSLPHPIEDPHEVRV